MNSKTGNGRSVHGNEPEGPLSERRILLLSYGCPPVVGGVERIVAGQARWLTRYGAQVEVVVGEGGQFDESIPLHQVDALSSRRGEEYRFPPEFNRMSFNAAINELRSRLAPILDRNDTWVIHNILTMPLNLPLTAYLHEAIESSSAQVVSWTHDVAWYDERYRTPDRSPWNLLKKSPGVSVHVAVSRHRKRQLRDLYGPGDSPIKVIPDAVDVGELLSFDTALRAFYYRHELHRDDLILLYPTRLVRRKNVEQALRVTAELREGSQRVDLIVTGPADPHNPDSNQYRDELIEKVRELELEDDVVFCSQEQNPVTGEPLDLSYKRIAQFYRMADLLLLTSRQEGFGIPLIESGLTGTLIACSQREPLPEVAGEHAFYFDLDEPPDVIAQNLQGRLQDEITIRARRRMRQNFTWPAVMEENVLPLLQEFSGVDPGRSGTHSN